MLKEFAERVMTWPSWFCGELSIAKVPGHTHAYAQIPFASTSLRWSAFARFQQCALVAFMLAAATNSKPETCALLLRPRSSLHSPAPAEKRPRYSSCRCSRRASLRRQRTMVTRPPCRRPDLPRHSRVTQQR